MTASVEIVFDNSDNRLPVTEKEVRIKRTIGLKKDEFKINDKSILGHLEAIMRLLEAYKAIEPKIDPV